MKQHSKPCSDCPFRRDCPPGVGGIRGPELVGQARGPFLLPCHDSPGYDEDKRSPNHSQCAGAAIFRSNVGWDVYMPNGMLKLPGDDSAVFSSSSGLIAHHQRITRPKALLIFMALGGAEGLLLSELANAGVQFVEPSNG